MFETVGTWTRHASYERPHSLGCCGEEMDGEVCIRVFFSISAMSIFLRCKHLTQNHIRQETLGSPRCADHWFLGDGPSEHVLGEFERCST